MLKKSTDIFSQPFPQPFSFFAIVPIGILLSVCKHRDMVFRKCFGDIEFLFTMKKATSGGRLL